MDVQIWHSYSCNNSSDYRLVARFADAKKAEKLGAELRTFFTAYAEAMDEYVEENDFPEKPIPLFVDFAAKHGVKAKAFPLGWGDGEMQGDEPDVAVAGTTLAIYHTYCGGFGKDLPAIITAAGGKLEKETSEAPDLSATFTLPAGKPGEKLAAQLVKFFAQKTQHEQICDFPEPPPWDKGQQLTYEDASTIEWALVERTFAFAMPFAIQGYDAFKAWLAKSKVSDVTITLADKDARAKVKKLAQKPAPAAATSAKATSSVDAKGKKFLFTGKLATMSRDEAKQRVAAIGGVSAGSVSKDLDFLVVGDEGSPLYGAGAKGDKLVAAEKLIAKGAALQIISENAFLAIGGGKAPPVKANAAKKVATPTPVAVATKIAPAGKKFLFTGTLATMTRDSAKKRVAELGGISAGSVSKDLDYLVVGDKAGTKSDKHIAAEALIAKGSALQIISETDFLAIKK